MSTLMARVVKNEQGWVILLTEAEVEKIKKAHFTVEGYNAIIANIQGGNPTEEIILKLGEASATLKDIGIDLVSKNIPELAESGKGFTWNCDFTSKELHVITV